MKSRAVSLFVLLLRCTLAVTAQTPVWTQFPNSPAGTTRNDDIYFTDLTNGWSARGTNGVYRTTNGGNSWVKVISNTGPMAHFRCIGFASATRGWAGNLGPGSYDGSVTDTNMLYETFDGGATWSVAPDINASGMKGFCAMHVKDAQHIYGVGRVRGPAYFAKSENGGASWWVTNLTAAGVMGGLMDVYFKDNNNGFIVGMDTNAFNSCSAPYYHGAIARTTNGGLSWQVVASTPVNCSYFWKMSWPSTNVGYVSLQQNGSYSTVIFYKTTDGGATWSSNGIPLGALGSTSFGLQGIGFVNENEGWMGGTTVLNPPYSFIHTTDGGLTWSNVGYDNTRAMNRIRFVSPNLGFGAGQKLHVYRVPLAITAPPTNLTLAIGNTATFSVTAQGFAPLTYQWRAHGTNLPGAIASSCSINNVQPSDAGSYNVVVSDYSGSITSATAQLTISGASPPVLLTQPQSRLVNQGEMASFNVAVSGTPPFTYRWRLQGTNLADGFAATYNISNTQPTNTGNYSVVVSNDFGSVTSADAILALPFVDTFEAQPLTVITNATTTNGYKIVWTAVAGPSDFRAIIGYDYSAVTYPTNIPPAPNSTPGTTKGLLVAVNKDAPAAAAAVNLYPLGVVGSGNFAFKFDAWLNWVNTIGNSEHALFGINHSAAMTNQIGLATSDGLFWAVNTDGGITATSPLLRDYSVFRGGGAETIPILMTTNNTAFGPTPPLGPQFDNLNPGFISLFPAKTIPGYGSTPAGSAGLGWVRGEVRQQDNLITCRLNGTIIAQYTNSFAGVGYTNGAVMIGLSDFFDSIGHQNNFVIFDNLRVQPLLPPLIQSAQVIGDTFQFSFNTASDDSYTGQWTTNLTAPVWTDFTNVIGNGGILTLQYPWAGDSSPRYFRVRQP